MKSTDCVSQLLWIGDSSHPSNQPAWALCQQTCDTISHRDDICSAVSRPTRTAITHVLIGQTNRHEKATLAMDRSDIATLAAKYPDAKHLVLRGPLVAPSVKLPGASGYIESLAWNQVEPCLATWLGTKASSSTQQRFSAIQQRCSAIIVLADRYVLAEPYLDVLESWIRFEEIADCHVDWCRPSDARRPRSSTAYLWDDSVASPVNRTQWQRRLKPFQSESHASQHVWLSAMASPEEVNEAISAGVQAVIPKPFRLVSLQSIFA